MIDLQRIQMRASLVAILNAVTGLKFEVEEFESKQAIIDAIEMACKTKGIKNLDKYLDQYVKNKGAK